ncbi:RodZ domain-containing protein [Paenactinomyces guangxiensis]|uniref:Helix-turn-helix domain-containing protein n=1 Tax=Paenactinomyces guangxiensis TaxID=1490290 RepID=A0A7W1WR19_9BACL|nr:helix-turn-helix domain-containing protein [Paenactinomyces guangxiensis]MBA4494407.1 helix-turn-helix domain-containing protein [Paenactinomyces guangxiensis]MBH8591538.1 helix-turn-helix domain-containing protein [Paenactinomyces guangxiensis]
MSVEIGNYLRQARESIGLSLDQLQDKTKIQKSFLTAIENGEFHKLPSPFYVRTYLRSYANCVKVEPHHILRQYRKAEQAERGLTGVHRAVNEHDLAQAKQTPPQNTGRMPVITGPQQSVSQMTGSMPHRLSNTLANTRTSMNTALTIARSESDQARDVSLKDKELARRNLGYQRTGGVMRSGSPSLPNDRPDLPPVPKPSISQSEPPVASSSEPLLSSMPPRRSRDTLRENTQKFNAGTLPTGDMNSLSRSARLRKDTSQASIPPSKPDVQSPYMKNPDEESGYTQRASRVQKLSRSAVKNRKSGKSRSSGKKRAAIIIAASAAVCIPLAWVAVHFASDQGEDDQSRVAAPPNNGGSAPPRDSSEVKEQPPSPKGTLKLASKESNVNHYHLTGTDQAEIEIQGRSGKSWVQIRDNFGTDKNYLKDVMVEDGQTFKYGPHTFDGNPDLWIVLGQPHQVTVKVNGEFISPAKNVHIKKVQ